MARSGMRCVLALGVVLCVSSFLCLLIATATPYWVQSWPRVFNQFKMIGMWEVCFAGLTFENPDPTLKMSYNGCWWTLSTYLNDIRSWMNPAWFVFAQVVTSVCLALEFLTVIAIIIVWFTTIEHRNQQHKKRHSIIPVNFFTFVTLICAILKTFMVVEFGIMVYYDREWMPHPEINYLSWSYGMAVISTFFSVFGSIALLNYRSLARQQYRGV